MFWGSAATDGVALGATTVWLENDESELNVFDTELKDGKLMVIALLLEFLPVGVALADPLKEVGADIDALEKHADPDEEIPDPLIGVDVGWKLPLPDEVKDRVGIDNDTDGRMDRENEDPLDETPDADVGNEEIELPPAESLVGTDALDESDDPEEDVGMPVMPEDDGSDNDDDCEGFNMLDTPLKTLDNGLESLDEEGTTEDTGPDDDDESGEDGALLAVGTEEEAGALVGLIEDAESDDEGDDVDAGARPLDTPESILESPLPMPESGLESLEELDGGVALDGELLTLEGGDEVDISVGVADDEAAVELADGDDSDTADDDDGLRALERPPPTPDTTLPTPPSILERPLPRSPDEELEAGASLDDEGAGVLLELALDEELDDAAGVDDDRDRDDDEDESEADELESDEDEDDRLDEDDAEDEELGLDEGEPASVELAGTIDVVPEAPNAFPSPCATPPTPVPTASPMPATALPRPSPNPPVNANN
ncbi:hypothetical protein B0H21DRAFT_891278 [Amylocystis lapponica]|nr:hypothetical protein B0H21DRAFT_891278 [Amylocystis lapponica]